MPSALLDKQDVKDLEDLVYNRIFEYLEIPSYEKGDDNKPKNVVNRAYLFNLNNPCRILHPEQYSHELRVAAYAVFVMNYLGFKDETYRIQFFIAALGHDLGKICAPSAIDKKEGFTQEDMERMKDHPIVGRDFIESDYPIAGNIVLGHHFYQPNGYPKLLPETTEEIKYLRKILGIIDFHDSASTRINSRTQKSFMDVLLGKRFPAKSKVKEALLKAYGILDMSYQGVILPQSLRTGEIFIEEMYEAQIFGKENPINPFNGFTFIKDNKP